jgi:cell division FtsZ-interacting protein ZapD
VRISIPEITGHGLPVKAISDFIQNLLKDLQNQNRGQPIPQPDQWTLNQRGRAVDLTRWNVLEASETLLEVLGRQNNHPSQPTDVEDKIHLYPDKATAVAHQDIAIPNGCIIQMPTSYLTLEIWLYRRSKKKREVLVRHITCMAPLDLTATQILDQMGFPCESFECHPVADEGTGGLDGAGICVQNLDRKLSGMGWRHGAGLRLVPK